MSEPRNPFEAAVASAKRGPERYNAMAFEAAYHAENVRWTNSEDYYRIGLEFLLGGGDSGGTDDDELPALVYECREWLAREWSAAEFKKIKPLIDTLQECWRELELIRDGFDEPTRRADFNKRRAQLFAAVAERDGEQCVACGSTDGLTVDHDMPLSRRGSNDLDNLSILCRKCNSSKHARTMREWVQEAVDEHLLRQPRPE